MPEFNGYAHVALTVTDLEKSLPFFTSVFETEPAGELVTDDFVRKIFPVAEGQVFGVTEYTLKGDADRFDPRHPGLDHVSFAVPSRGRVMALKNRLADAGIDGDLVEAPYGTVLNVKDPDGNAIEFFAPSAG